MPNNTQTKHTCGDCGKATGEYHIECCDIERCPFCGLQALSCGCAESIETHKIGDVISKQYFINGQGEKKERIRVANSIDEDFGD